MSTHLQLARARQATAQTRGLLRQSKTDNAHLHAALSRAVRLLATVASEIGTDCPSELDEFLVHACRVLGRTDGVAS